jgi:NTE family protein
VLEAELDGATTYAGWLEVARELDQASGAEDWRGDDASPYYDAERLRADLAVLRTRRASGDGAGLADALSTSVYRHQADLAAPELYDGALAGTKHLVGAWLDEVEASLRWLVANPIRGLGLADKRARFEQAWRVYGRSALLLSGGATWGFHHLGVVKALFENHALPHILSGASTGAMVASGICSRDDAGLRALFADPGALRLDGLAPVGLSGALRSGAWLDPRRFHEVIRHNCGDLTFAEAFARSGRALNISVSPTRTRQKPRLLSHLTAPEVLVPSAALASSALPGLFPPVELQARAQSGGTMPYAPGELWADGSIYGDLPKLRLARLHNVNHFIVSQTNPHVAPLLRLRERGGFVTPAVAGAATVTARAHGAYAADLARRAAPAWSGPVRQLADRAYALVSQDYRGDIDIHPRFRPELLVKLVKNPTRADLDTFIREGERATFPKLPQILDQTRLGRVFAECAAALGAIAGG